MDVKRIHAAAAAYARRGDRALAERLGFFGALWGVQECIEREVSTSHPYACPSSAEVAAWAAAGTPVLSQAPAYITVELLSNAASLVAARFVEKGGFSDVDQEALKSADWARIVALAPVEVAGANPEAYLDAVMNALANAEASACDGALLEPRLAGFVLSAAIKPLISSAATSVCGLARAGLVQLHAPEGGKPMACPVCGGEATIAYVGPNPFSSGNGRMLWCGQCGAEWEFERVRCARCGTQNPAHLHYVSVEGDESHRLHVCDECGGHIRTRFVEAGDLTPFSYEVEDVVTANLELVAQQLKQDNS